MTIDRRQLFRLAWKSAKGTAAGYSSLRAAFAAALRRVWGLVKAMVKEEARRLPVIKASPNVPSWWNQNPHRARAAAAGRARLGTLVHACW